MAARESQGLQIAVIIFAMLTIVLAITTYIFYSQSEQAEQKRRDAANRATQAEAAQKKLLYQVRAMQFVLGDADVDMETVKAARDATGEDELAARVLKNFDSDMGLYGEQAGVEGPRNYRTLPQYLLGTIASKQIAMSQSTKERNDIQTKSAADLATEKALVQKSDAAKEVAVADLAKERQQFDAQRTEVTQAKDALVGQIGEKDKALKKERDDRSKDVTNLNTQLVNVSNQAQTLKNKIEEFNAKEVNRFETPDGRITWVNQAQRVCWVNLGRHDGLQRQTTFTVFDHDENGVTITEPKGRVEVIRVVDDHLSECRILEDKANKPILPNDVVHTPVWSPGQVVRFALAGFMDINGDGESDRDLVRSIIKLQGGEVDAEVKDDGTREGQLTVNTRYVVMGDKPTDKTDKRSLEEYNRLVNDMNKFGTEQISVQKLLAQMGWKTEERTVQLGKSAAASEFKTRAPKAKPAAAGAGGGAAAPVPVAPAARPAGGEVDPFK